MDIENGYCKAATLIKKAFLINDPTTTPYLCNVACQAEPLCTRMTYGKGFFNGICDLRKDTSLGPCPTNQIRVINDLSSYLTAPRTKQSTKQTPALTSLSLVQTPRSSKDALHPNTEELVLNLTIATRN